MLLRLVRSNSPLLFILFLLVSAALWLPAFGGMAISPFSFDYHQMPFYGFLYEALNEKGGLQVVVTFVLLILQALLLLKINREYILLDRQNYLPAIVFVILTSCFIQLQRLNPAIFASFFIILMIDQLFSGYREKYILNRLFISGALVAIASLFYPFAIFYFLVIWISLILLRSFSLREWFTPVLGLVFPFLFVFGYHYISDSHSVPALIELIKESFMQGVTITHYSYAYYALYGFIGLLIFTGSFTLLNKFPGRKIYIRKFYEIFWWSFVVGILLFFFEDGVSVEMIYFVAFPISFLLADFLNTIKSGVFGNIVLFLLTGLIVYVYYANA